MSDDTPFVFSNNYSISNPEERIREYCKIEIYKGYDDRHSINDKINSSDIDAANNLYAMIDRYDKTESKRILENSPSLESIPDKNIEEISDNDWEVLKEKIKIIFKNFLAIKGVGVPKTTKLLHLKRPGMFPILDSFVIKFLTGMDIANVSKERHVRIGIKALDTSRNDILNNFDILSEIQQNIKDLPILMKNVRLYDILCWTEEKWVIRENHNAPFGTVSKSITTKEKNK